MRKLLSLLQSRLLGLPRGAIPGILSFGIRILTKDIITFLPMLVVCLAIHHNLIVGQSLNHIFHSLVNTRFMHIFMHVKTRQPKSHLLSNMMEAQRQLR